MCRPRLFSIISITRAARARPLPPLRLPLRLLRLQEQGLGLGQGLQGQVLGLWEDKHQGARLEQRSLLHPLALHQC